MTRAAVGIDLGGTELRAAVVDEGGRVLSRAQTKTDARGGPAAVIEQMAALFADVRDAVPGVTPVGIGVGSPGPLDAEAGIVIGPPTLHGWRDVPLRDLLAERLGLPVRLDNDGHAAVLGEWRFGAGRGLSSFVYITVSTGIGGGIVVDGHLLRGRRGMAAHVGHMIVEAGSDVVCSCGNPGCWEALASGSALDRAGRAAAAREPGGTIARIAAGNPVTARHVMAAAREGDDTALALVGREGRYLGAGIVSLLHLFSPERVVIGGGLSNGLDLLADPIRATIAARAMPAFRDVPVGSSALGLDVGLIGAAALAL